MRSFSKNCYEYTLVYTETMVFQDRILQRVAGGGWPVTGDLHINILTRTIFPKKKLRNRATCDTGTRHMAGVW